MKIDETGLFKRCSCTEEVRDEDGNPVLDGNRKPKRRELGTKCPKLKDRNHGTWWFQVDIAPPSGSGKQRQRLRRGGFSTKSEAAAKRNKILGEGENASQRRIPNDQITVSEWLDKWLHGKRNIRKATLRSYTGQVENYLEPYLGHVKLVDLEANDIRRMFDAIDERNREIEDALKITPRRKRGDKTKAGEVRETRRVAGPATQQRIRACLRAALNSAIRERKITVNPASHVELASGKSPKPLIWTQERIARWQETGEMPSRVMVWTPEHTGRFLDHAQKDRLYGLYLTVAFTGLRRGEACGLRWIDLDLDGSHTMTIETQLTQNGWEVEEGEPKSDAGARVITLAPDVVKVLKALRRAQRVAKLERGAAWVDSGRVFTQEDGSQLIPDAVSERFRQLVAEAGLPPIRLHDLRHGAATLLLEAGVDIKVVQEMLGHSSSTLTRDTYTSVSNALMAKATARIAKLVPRAAAGTGGTAAASGGTNGNRNGTGRGKTSISTGRKGQVNGGAPPGTRTPNPLIKSWLYRLTWGGA